MLDEEASIANPLLFTEYLEADDDEKRMIEVRLHPELPHGSLC